MKSNLLLVLILGIFLIGCNSSNSSTKSKICPQCNMPLPTDNKYTAYIKDGNYFDDIGCLILWSRANKIELKSQKVFVFDPDRKEYIDAKTAHYTIDEKTPMNYGFVGYTQPKEDRIDFKEMQLRMLRGEHLANPKIRKKIIGH